MTTSVSYAQSPQGTEIPISFNQDTRSGFSFYIEPNPYQSQGLETQLDEQFMTAIKKHHDVAVSVDNIRTIYTSSIENTWNAEDFKNLEMLLHQFKEVLVPTIQGGEATQPLFYEAIAKAGLALETSDPQFVFEERINRWRKAYPESLAPDIALATYYYNKAFKARGGEAAYKTPQENFQQFHGLSLKAYQVLAEAQQQGKKLDSQFYATELTVLLCLSAPNELIQARFQEGLKLDPNYLPLYDDMAFIVMPRWQGDSDDLAGLAHYIRGMHPNFHNRDGLYVRIVENVLWAVERTPEEFLSYGFSWPIIKSGYIHDAKFSGLSTAHADMFCWLAVLYDDKPTAKILFDALESKRYRLIWGEDQTLYNKAKNWANGIEPNNPLRPPLDDGSPMMVGAISN